VMVGDKVYSSMCQELRIDSIAEAEKWNFLANQANVIVSC
jgi:hypothetical protein